MRLRRVLAFALVLMLLTTLVMDASRYTAQAYGTRQLVSAGTTQVQSGPLGSDGGLGPETPPGEQDSDGGSTPPPTHRSNTHRYGYKAPAPVAPAVASSKVAGSNPGLTTSFNGLNLYQQRYANGGNQFTVEPPDQALCVGGGFVLEAVNDVLNVYDTAGNSKLGVTDLNTFYHYAAAINRTTGVQGPFVTDPVCHFDADSQRWFLVVLTLDVKDGDYTGRNHLDIAVSSSADPTKTWNIYQLPAQDDGTEGTPVHKDCPCIGDYPHIGADKYGIYLTTNEYPFFVDGYNGAQIYAISKKDLVSAASAPKFVQFESPVLEKAGTSSFTVWPAIVPGTNFNLDNNGTEFFLNSMAAPEANPNTTGYDNRLGVWALTNTQSIDSNNPNLVLSSRSLDVETYGIPPAADQKNGPHPYGELQGLPVGKIDASDSRMQQVVYANGLLYGALDTAVNVGGAEKAGVAYFIIKPVVIGGGQHVGPQTSVVNQGYVALTNNNVAYPAIGVLANGQGVMAVNVVGQDYYPSAAYVSLDAKNGAGDIHIARAGQGPQDGFSEYGDRPRWGDYGAAAMDGNNIWFASEYIGQQCTVQQYLADPRCGNTRAPLGNWATRISSVKP